MNVDAIMTRNPITVRRGTSLDQALDLMDEHDIRHLPVLDDEGLAGVISDRELLDATGRLHPQQRQVLEAPESNVGEILKSPVASVVVDESITNALGLFIKRRIGCVPVLDSGAVAGIVTEVDILKAYSRACRRGDIGPSTDPTIEQHMSPNPATIQSDSSGEEVAEAMKVARVRHLPVLEGTKLVGIVSDRDIRTARGRGQLELTLVTELMSPIPETISPATRLSSVALILSAERISALPVTENGDLVGIATTLDVMLPCAMALQQI